MAWNYSDYVTYSPATDGATRLSRLRSHIQEVSDKITAEMSSAGASYAARERRAYLDGLKREEIELEKRLGLAESANAQAGRLVYAGLRNRRRSTEES